MWQLSKQKTKSPSKSSKSLTPKTKKASPTKYKNGQLRERYRQKFDKNIQYVTSICQQLAEMNMPQKCLQHNSNYTLYCENDNKILCPKCMYKNSIHTNHQVKPLQNCTQNLYQDASKQQRNIENIQQNVKTYKQYVSSKISNIEKQFPYAKVKIQQLFKYLHQFLFDLEKQFMKQLRAYKGQLVDQQNILLTEINNTQNYIFDKMKKYQNKKDVDFLIIKINLNQTLKQIQKMIAQQLRINLNEKQDVFKFKNEVKQQMAKFIEEKTKSWMPWAKKNNEQNNKQLEKQLKTSSEKKLKQKSESKSKSKSKKKVFSKEKNVNIFDKNKRIKKQNLKQDKSLIKRKQQLITNLIKVEKKSKSKENLQKNKTFKTQTQQKPLKNLYHPKITIVRNVQKQLQNKSKKQKKQDLYLQNYILRTPSKQTSSSRSKSNSKSRMKFSQKQKYFIKNIKQQKKLKTTPANHSTKSLNMMMTSSTVSHDDKKQKIEDPRKQNQNSSLIQFLVRPVKMQQVQKPERLSPFFKRC